MIRDAFIYFFEVGVLLFLIGLSCLKISWCQKLHLDLFLFKFFWTRVTFVPISDFVCLCSWQHFLKVQCLFTKW